MKSIITLVGILLLSAHAYASKKFLHVMATIPENPKLVSEREPINGTVFVNKNGVRQRITWIPVYPFRPGSLMLVLVDE